MEAALTPEEQAKRILKIARAGWEESSTLAALEAELASHASRRRREQAETLLRENVELTARILETVPGGVVVVSPQGGVLKANAEAIRILGLSYDELGRRYVADFAAKTYREDGSEFPVEDYPVSRCLATGEPQPPATVGVEQPSGAIVWAVFRAVPFVDPNSRESLGAVVTFLDITHRKEAEEERLRLEERVQQTQRLESLGVLAGGIAHDFNNLLVSILGNTELALYRLEPEARARELVSDVRAAALRASELTTQLLAYSGEGPIVSVPVDPRGLVNEMTRLMRATLFGRAQLKLELPAELPAVTGDATQLRQIVMNLIANAVESLQHEPGTVHVRLGVADRDQVIRGRPTMTLTELSAHRYVWLEVEDDGCGMDLVTQRRLFDPFFTTKFTGRGLGLATVLGILRQHEGAVSVSSEPGVGTRIRVFLPSTGDPLPSPAPLDEPWSTSRRSGLVLVVDDELHVRLVAERVLQEFGYEVLTAASGREGLAMIRKHERELGIVLLDLLMDDMDGEEVLSELKTAGVTVPVILCSGYGREVPARFTGYDLADYLVKPYQLEELVEAVGTAIRRAPV